MSAKSAPELAVKPDIGASPALHLKAGFSWNFLSCNNDVCRASVLSRRLTRSRALLAERRNAIPDGFLVGNASLKAQDFIDICKSGAIKANVTN